MCDEDLAQAEFAEHVNDCLHGRVIGDGDGCQVEDSPQLHWGRAAARRRHARREQEHRVARHTFLSSFGIRCIESK